MKQRPWFMAVPVAVMLGVGGWSYFRPTAPPGANGRIVGPEFIAMERRVGYHLYAPTWLPEGGRLGANGVRKGMYRILLDYTDLNDRGLLFVAQERRTPSRDRYHANVFERLAEAKAQVKGRPAYLVTGKTGERRLFWNEDQVAVIISSPTLSDDELLQIAERVR